MRTQSLVTCLALVLVFPPAAAADPPDGQIIVVPGDHNGVMRPPNVDIGVVAPGKPGRPASGSGNASGTAGNGDGSVPICNYTLAPESPDQLASQLPDWHAGSIGGDGKAAYYKKCAGRLFGWVTGPGQGPGGQVLLPTPAQLAAQAFDQMALPLPIPRHSPDVRLADGRAATIVGEHTWLWTERSVWGPRAKRVQAGPVWAEVTARPQTMSFDSGYAGGVTCTGPGTAYSRTYGLHAPSPDCDFVYPRSSYGLPKDVTTARFAITWKVSWVGSTGTAPAGGVLPDMVSRASVTLAVAEAQALRSG